MAGGSDAADRWIAVCSVDRLAADAIVPVRIADVALLVMQDGDDIFAVERACPHEQADLRFGCVRDGRLHCPRHQASFDLRSGAITPGWPSRGLRRFPARRSGDHVLIDRDTLNIG